MTTLRHTILLIMAMAAAMPGMAMDGEPPTVVAVKGMKDPEMRSFRHVTAGLDMFDKHRAMAPKVDALRFKLKPRESTEDKSTDGITLSIVGKAVPTPVVIEADGGFTIVRDQQAYDDDADLLFNRKRRQYLSIADIRTPGLPDNVRRMGDLRLECKVNIAIIKKEVPFLVNATINTLLMTTDWCGKLPIFFSLPTAGKMAKATLVYQDRRQEVNKQSFENGFESMLVDPSWPDDTLLEMEMAPP